MIRWLWRWGPAVAMMAVIFYASSIPDLTALPGGISDKVGHGIGYGLLGALLLRAFAAARLANVGAATSWPAWLASVAYGVTDEFHQRFVPGRTPDVNDVIADGVGAALAIVACWLLAAATRARRRAV
jgi:VanZ family protein